MVDPNKQKQNKILQVGLVNPHETVGSRGGWAEQRDGSRGRAGGRVRARPGSRATHHSGLKLCLTLRSPQKFCSPNSRNRKSGCSMSGKMKSGKGNSTVFPTPYPQSFLLKRALELHRSWLDPQSPRVTFMIHH